MEHVLFVSIFVTVVYLQHCFRINGQFPDKSYNGIIGWHGRSKRAVVNASRFTDPCRTSLVCRKDQDMEVPLCYCDDLCTEFNDCCYYYTPKPTTVQHRIQGYKDYFRCRVHVISEHRSSSMGIHVVSKCPPDYSNETISRACFGDDVTPVTDAYNITFANKYCAICHGVTSFTFWTVRVQADREMCHKGLINLLENNQTGFSNVNIEDFFNLKCYVTFIPPRDSRYRVCYITGQQSPAELEKLCNGYFNPIEVWDSNFRFRVYKNAHCIDKKKIRGYRCLSDGSFDPQKTFGAYDLTVMFNIHNQRQNTVKLSRPVKNERTDQCLKIGCSSSNQRCTEYSVQIKNYPLKLSMIFVSNSTVNIDKETAERLVSFYLSCLPTSANDIQIQYWNVMIGRLNNSVSNSNQVENAVYLQIGSSITKFSTKEDVLKFKRMLSLMKLNYTEDIHVENGSSSTIHFWKENRNIKEIEDMYIWDRSVLFHENVAFDVLSNLNTTFLTLNTSVCVPVVCNIRASVYLDQSPNPSLLHFLLNKYVCSFEQQTKTTNEVFVTADSEFLYQNETLDRVFIQSVMTYICLSISSFAALNTFCIFLKLELFKSIAGIISQNVLIVIFFFNIFFMLGTGLNDFPILCFLSGILTHYLALTYFLWITIFVVHTVVTIKTAKTFKKPNPNDQTRRLKTMICLFGYSSATIVVIPSVVIDSCNCTEYEIGYGGQVCFPTAFPSNLAVFIAPTGFCIVINMLCLLYSAIVLSKLNTTMTHEGLQKSRSYVIVFLRMCCVSAISWLLGVIAGIFDEIIIGFCFIILSGLHGFIICVCLLSTNVFRDALQAYKNKNTSSGTEIELIVADDDNLQTKAQEA